MSELINIRDNRAAIRWKLLTGVSAIALTATVSSVTMARAEDSAQPQIWIELGGQLSRLDDGQEAFAPPLMAARPAVFLPSQKFERPPIYAFDETGKISFGPENSGWVFSAAIRYGRSASNRNVHQQTSPAPIVKYYSGANHNQYPKVAKFASAIAGTSETHFVIDFQAGKDVGLGMFGGSSTINLGVRFAQFSSKSNAVLGSDPDAHPTFKYAYGQNIHVGADYHLNAASLDAARSFHGVGPSISWNGSAPVAGNTKDGEVTLDWGVNAALLFGRQRAKVHHQSTSLYHHGKYSQYNFLTTPHRNAPPDQVRLRSVTVPNVGGFAGITFRIEDFKLSAGYRADFFFNAIDGGIDTRKNESSIFNGPYASISVGLGD